MPVNTVLEYRTFPGGPCPVIAKTILWLRLFRLSLFVSNPGDLASKMIEEDEDFKEMFFPSALFMFNVHTNE